jgi:hypothetical protein
MSETPGQSGHALPVLQPAVCANKRLGARLGPNHQISIDFGRRNGVSSGMTTATLTRNTSNSDLRLFIFHLPRTVPILGRRILFQIGDSGE